MAGTFEDGFLPVQRQANLELRYRRMCQQASRRDALVDGVGWHLRMHELLAEAARALATRMAFHGEHAGLLVQPLGHVFAEALHGLATASGGAGQLVQRLLVGDFGDTLLDLSLQILNAFPRMRLRGVQWICSDHGLAS